MFLNDKLSSQMTSDFELNVVLTSGRHNHSCLLCMMWTSRLTCCFRVKTRPGHRQGGCNAPPPHYKTGCTLYEFAKYQRHADQPANERATPHLTHVLPLLDRHVWKRLIFKNLRTCRMFCVYLLTPWSTVLLEKLTGFQLVKKSPALY